MCREALRLGNGHADSAGASRISSGGGIRTRDLRIKRSTPTARLRPIPLWNRVQGFLDCSEFRSVWYPGCCHRADATVSKTVVGLTVHRGFESLPLRF